MAAGKKFNLTELLNQRSKEAVAGVTAAGIENIEQTESKTTAEKTEAIDWEDIYNIIPDEGNFYRTEDVEDLKQSIELMGMLQPLLVSEADQSGKRSLYAGHRRRKAILQLVEEGKEQFRQVPIMVRKRENDILDRLALIMANRFREKTGWEKMTEVVETERLVKELKKDMNLQGRTRDLLAEIIESSPAQVGRYKTIHNNLIPEMMKKFQKNQISTSIAIELCGLNEDSQRKANVLLEDYGELTIWNVKDLKRREEQERQVPGQMNIEMPEENVTKMSTKEPEENVTKMSTKEPEENVTKMSTKEPEENVTKMSTKEPEENVTKMSTKEPEENVTKMSTKEPEENVTKMSTKEPEQNVTKMSTKKCITGKSPYGICPSCGYNGVKCCAECKEDCNIRCGWINQEKNVKETEVVQKPEKYLEIFQTTYGVRLLENGHDIAKESCIDELVGLIMSEISKQIAKGYKVRIEFLEE